MAHARDVEMQISWACSSQNPDMLPDEVKGPKADFKQQVKARLSGVFPQ